MSITPIGASTIDPNALREVMGRANQSSSQKIDQAGEQFEAIFVRNFLGDSLKPMIGGSLEEKGAANDIYRGFLTDMLSQSMAQKGVFGFGKQISSQIKSQMAAKVAMPGDSSKLNHLNNSSHTLPVKSTAHSTDSESSTTGSYSECNPQGVERSKDSVFPKEIQGHTRSLPFTHGAQARGIGKTLGMSSSTAETTGALGSVGATGTMSLHNRTIGTAGANNTITKNLITK